MNVLQIRSVDEDVRADPETLRLAQLVALRSSMFGFPIYEQPVALGRLFFADLVSCLHTQGVATAVPSDRQVVAAWPLRRYLSQTLDAIDACPQPSLQWPVLRETLGDALLSSLVGPSESSLRRYAGGARATPDDVAARLHALSRIVSSLAGSYNDYGIRRWFGRPRAQLDGRAPAALLAGGWNPDDPDPQRVQQLADALLGAGAAA